MVNKNLKKYFSISLVVGSGMVISLFADLSIGRIVLQKDMDQFIRALTLIFAFDILVRESLRFSLLHHFSNQKSKMDSQSHYSDFMSSCKSIGVVLSIVFTIIYVSITGNMNDILDFLSAFILFYFIFLASACQLILNLKGEYVLASIRSFFLPLGILFFLFSNLGVSMECCVVAFVFIYLFIANVFLANILIVSNFEFNYGRIKGYLIPVSFPASSYFSLQSSRYLERDFSAHVSVGGSYLLYFSFKIYSSLLSIISMPISMILSKRLVDINVEINIVKKLLTNITLGVLIIWLIMVAIVYMLTLIPECRLFFPLITDQKFIHILILYLAAALFGCFNIPIQAILYRMKQHKRIMFIVIVLNLVYLLALCILYFFYADLGLVLVQVIGICFFVYTFFEFLAYLVLLRSVFYDFN